MFGTVNTSNSKLSNRAFAMALIIGAIFISACGNEKNSSNEECYYEIYDVLATVKNLKPNPEKDGEILIVLDFDGSSLAFEDQTMNKWKPDVKIDHDFLVRNSIEIGNRYEATVSEISKGNCTPIFVSFHHQLN